MTYAAVAIGGNLIGGVISSRSSKKTAKQALALQREQFEFQKQRYNEYKALYGNTEKMLVADAEKGVVADLNGVTNRAATDVASQFANAENARLRNMQRMGINPNSGRADALASQAGIAQSLAAAGSITANRETERRNAEQQTWNRRDSVTRLGAGLMSGAAGGMDSANAGMVNTLNNQSAAQAAQAGQMFGAAGTMLGGMIGKSPSAVSNPTTTPVAGISSPQYLPVTTTPAQANASLVDGLTAGRIPGIDLGSSMIPKAPNYSLYR